MRRFLSLLFFHCLLVISGAAQASWWMYGGADYNQTEIQQVPANTQAQAVPLFGAMYSPAQGLGWEKPLKDWLHFRTDLGYAQTGNTNSPFFQREEFHYVQLAPSVFIHPVNAPAWMQRFWIGGGPYAQILLGQHNILLGRTGDPSDSPPIVWGLAARARYAFTERLFVSVSYQIGMNPYYWQEQFGGALRVNYMNRSAGLALHYRLVAFTPRTPKDKD
ncbi:MAG: hypothetical protein AAFV07_09505 [Bacteroidota bacterium]